MARGAAWILSRVVRGGSWNNNPRNCRAACRNHNTADNRNDNRGFRVCCGAHIASAPGAPRGDRNCRPTRVCRPRPGCDRCDDLLAACRPRGLPIGNLTSQFWSNCYLHGLDLFVKRELGCRAYLRYVDDLALFADDKPTLWAWKRALVERLARLRLTIHQSSTQVAPTASGIPWLGFVVYPTHRRVKARRVRHASRRLGGAYEDYRSGVMSFGEFDARVQGWINHVRHADSWGLRRHVLEPFHLEAGDWPGPRADTATPKTGANNGA